MLIALLNFKLDLSLCCLRQEANLLKQFSPQFSVSLTEVTVAPEQPGDVPGHGAVAGGAGHPSLGLHLGDNLVHGPETGARDNSKTQCEFHARFALLFSGLEQLCLSMYQS